jgi:hypothetical protein
MIKYVYKINVDLVKRMYVDHGYSVDDICLRLRYEADTVKQLVKNFTNPNLDNTNYRK